MNPVLISLHKHWCTADAVKQFVTADLKEFKNGEFPEWFAAIGNTQSKMSRMCVWYALLYVVVEGFKELKLSHPAVDECLKNDEYVNQLRRFRNAIFHYQKNPFSEKLLEFLEAEESENWIRELNKALEKFFLDALPIEEQIEKIKNMT